MLKSAQSSKLPNPHVGIVGFTCVCCCSECINGVVGAKMKTSVYS